MKKYSLIILGIIVIAGIVVSIKQRNESGGTPSIPNDKGEISLETNKSTTISKIDEVETEQIDKDTLTVTYTTTGFSPSTISIEPGDTVSFVNKTSSSMWVASDPHPQHTLFSLFDAGKGYKTEEVYSFTFTEPGTYTYHDHQNPKMKGTVEVK